LGEFDPIFVFKLSYVMYHVYTELKV